MDQTIFGEVLNELSEAIVIYDKNNDFVACNQANHDLYPYLSPLYRPGINLKEILERAFTTGQWNTEKLSMDAFVQERLAQHQIPFHETEQNLEDGRWLLVRNKRLPSGLFVGTRTDITELKEREVKLNEAMKVAESAERAKSEFLANMSHEIRTPMNGVMGMAELLMSTELDSKQKMFTDVIVKSGASLLTIINDILDFSKIEAGQMVLDPAPFNLAEAIEDVATLVSAKVAEKDLELIVRVDPQLPTMLVGDVGRIRQIVTNLMGNAVKFTEKGHVYVNVSGEIDEQSEGATTKLRMSVEDTGIGIPKEQCATVFQKFSQVDTSATRKHEGTGLGLSISASLVELMDGEIGVESEPGHGSTFWFTASLPIHDDIIVKHPIPSDMSGTKILIIDDNRVNRAILTEQMASWNFDSAAACSGREGLEVMNAMAANAVELDLVILDYQMPNMSGEEVLAEIKTNSALQNIPVVMLTSVDGADINRRLTELGAAANLAKPTRSSMLLETILQVVANKRGEAETVINSDVDEVPNDETQVKKPSSLNDETHLDILVAEDNEVNQIVFQQVLEQTGLSFRIVENGRLALASYKVKQPRLILMDVSMPEMNGKDATMAIREYEQIHNMKHTPIIGVTAHALKGDKETCLEAGMDDYLPKPLSPITLQEKIQSWIANEKVVQSN